jgi:transposase-like protein
MAMSEAEKKALKETLAERAKARKKMTPEQHEADVVEKINAMSPADKAIAKKIHALVK